MNDTTRQVAGVLGVAIVGSLLASTCASSLGTGVPEAARASVGAALPVAADLGGGQEAALALAAKSAFVDGMHVGVVAAGVAVFGSIVALAFLPSRAREETEVEAPAVVEVAAA